MNNSNFVTQGNKNVESSLTVPSGSPDIRLVGESSDNQAAKRRGFRKMTKGRANTRPARRIKLNRSIFNAETTAKPTFHIKTLTEIKTEKEAIKDAEKPGKPATEAHTEASPIENNVPSTAPSLPARLVINNHSSPSTDTRTVIKRESSTRRLLLPTIRLNRVATQQYKRSFTNQSLPQNARKVIKSEPDVVHTVPNPGPRLTVPTQPPQGSPIKKRKVSPICLTIPEVPPLCASPLKRRKISPIRSPESEPSFTAALDETPTSPLPPSPAPPSPAPSSPAPPSPAPPSPAPPESPPSPALSLGVQSDDELDNKLGNTTLGNSRVIVMAESINDTTIQHSIESSVLSRLGPPTQKEHIPQENDFADDRLDVISVIAADDELFLEAKPGPLKRSLSQDSIFNEESNKQGNIRSLSKKTQVNPKHLVGNLITKKPVPKNFRIPCQNSTGRDTLNRNCRLRNNSDDILKQNSVEKNSKHPGTESRKTFHRQNVSQCSPKPTRVVSNVGQSLNGLSVQEKVRSIRRNLGCKNVHEAWSIIKELDNMKSDIDIRMLEETVKVCELVSLTKPSPELAETVVGIFEMLKQREALKPMGYLLTILTLCRCGKFQEGFDYLAEMVETRVIPQQEFLVHFINNLNKCLRVAPKWIFELLQYITKFNFSNPTHVFNSCLSTFAATPVELLKEIAASQWDVLISLVCTPPNAQGATLIQNIMVKHCIPMSDESTTKLLTLYQGTKCIKQLLDLLHLKSADQAFDIGPIFADESLNLHDVEAHIAELIKAGVIPREDIFNKLIEKASAMKEFDLIYGLFLKYKSSTVLLSITALKKMVDVLENWDENPEAAVEVYSTLRQAKIAVKKRTSIAPPLTLPKKPFPATGQCFPFMKEGWCHHGDRCRFSHIVDNTPQLFRQHSESRNDVGGNGKQMLNQNSKIQNNFPNTSGNNTVMNGVGHNMFPSFQQLSFVVPLFPPSVQNHTPTLRVPQPVMRHPPPNTPRHQQHNVQRHPQANATRPPFPSQFQGKRNPTPRLATHNGHGPGPRLSKPFPLMFRPLSDPRSSAPNTNKVKLNRSFSWEPANNPRPKLRISPLLQQPSPGSDKNNNKPLSEYQQRVECAVASKDWPEVYLCYVESKQANDKTVQASDLKIFRSAFTKDVSAVGTIFSEFVDFVFKEKSSVKSSHSGSGECEAAFDRYDMEFLASLGVSLMEKCLVTKKFDKGYEVLHSLHAHNISYFDCGKNFGAYTRDIPPSAVAIIAVKLCMGMSQEDGLLGAMEVLRASNYAKPDDDISPDNMEYRVKVLQQVFTQLFDQGNISEAYEVLQHLNAIPSVMLPLYVKVLTHYSSVDDFDQSFDVLAEMQGKGVDLDIPTSRSLYEKFLKLCLTNEQDDEALNALNEIESREITLNGDIWKNILNQHLTTTNEILIEKLFQRCLNLGVYSSTFSEETPWLCQLGCGYSKLEVKLIIVRHLKDLRQHLNTLSTQTLQDFQIILYPRVSEGNMNQIFDEGIQTAMSRNVVVVLKVLQEHLNPPLMISEQKQEQFHSNFIVDAMSLYRWFAANDNLVEVDDGDEEDDVSSKGSIGSCVSYMTRMTEFD